MGRSIRPLIKISQQYLIECDMCDFKIPNTTDNISPDDGIEYIDMPCPSCGHNLLTKDDFNSFRRMMIVINWINKWFSWVTVFTSKPYDETGYMKVHKGYNYFDKK